MPMKIEITRKANIKDKDTVILNSTAHEEMSHAEFMSMYNKKAAELSQDQEALDQGKQQLREIKEIKEDEELSQFAEKMKLCERLKNKLSLQLELRDMEVRIQAKEKELKDMSSTFIELQQQKKKQQNG